MKELGKSGESHTNSSGTSQSATLAIKIIVETIKQVFRKRYKLFLASIVLLVTGDTWNITLRVHNRLYAIAYHIVNGQKIFYETFASKLLSDFFTPIGLSIGDLLIIAGLSLLTIFAILFIADVI